MSARVAIEHWLSYATVVYSVSKLILLSVAVLPIQCVLCKYLHYNLQTEQFFTWRADVAVAAHLPHHKLPKGYNWQ